MIDVSSGAGGEILPLTSCRLGRAGIVIRHGLPAVGCRRLGSISATLDGKLHHLKRAFVLVALVPGTRWKPSQRVLPGHYIAQFKRLAQLVIGFIRLVVQDD